MAIECLHGLRIAIVLLLRGLQFASDVQRAHIEFPKEAFAPFSLDPTLLHRGGQHAELLGQRSHARRDFFVLAAQAI